MDENIVVDLGEARDAVVEGDGRVEPEQSQVEVSSGDVLALQGVRLDRAALMRHLVIYKPLLVIRCVGLLLLLRLLFIIAPSNKGLTGVATGSRCPFGQRLHSLLHATQNFTQFATAGGSRSIALLRRQLLLMLVMLMVFCLHWQDLTVSSLIAAILGTSNNLLLLLLLLLLSTLLFFGLHLFDEKVFVEELGEDLLRKLAPKLGHEVPRRQILRRLQLFVDLCQRGHAKNIVVNDAYLYI